jgi:hypothetical protein
MPPIRIAPKAEAAPSIKALPGGGNVPDRYTPFQVHDRYKPVGVSSYDFFVDTASKSMPRDYNFPSSGQIPATQRWKIFGISAYVSPLHYVGVTAAQSGYLQALLDAGVTLVANSVEVWKGNLGMIYVSEPMIAGTTTADTPTMAHAVKYGNKAGYYKFGRGTEIDLVPGSSYKVSVNWAAASNASNVWYLNMVLHANKVEVIT